MVNPPSPFYFFILSFFVLRESFQTSCPIVMVRSHGNFNQNRNSFWVGEKPPTLLYKIAFHIQVCLFSCLWVLEKEILYWNQVSSHKEHNIQCDRNSRFSAFQTQVNELKISIKSCLIYSIYVSIQWSNI